MTAAGRLRAALEGLALRAGAAATGLPAPARALLLRLSLPGALERRDLAALLRALAATPPPPGRTAARPADPTVPDVADRLLRPVRFWGTTCLYRSLARLSIYRAAGLRDVQLVIGVRLRDGELQAHAWIARDGRPFREGDPQLARDFAVALVYPHPEAPPPCEEANRVSPPRTRDDVLLTELPDGTGVLLDLRSKFYYTLNAVGVTTWKLLSSGQAASADALAEALCREFEVDVATARADVEALLRELRAEGLLPAESA